ncbi:hypothetical protein BU14_0031s0115 [Porphyra umbilicalis]|uniref:Uncharacterized protein n=1 Tax=Porphyra umbilicalis TaxID=2786 RepID=A0A1X6PJL5_PORUM|nr:hypothetical protein BU14_0031s0115 [Porphyra umbilicalis]|eukprot:OSX80946.1 hypothetical protein BU14_0031s0115 [Porphyra umbilicalis]
MGAHTHAGGGGGHPPSRRGAGGGGAHTSGASSQLRRSQHKRLLGAIRAHDADLVRTLVGGGGSIGGGGGGGCGGGGGGSATPGAAASDAAVTVLLTLSRTGGSGLHAAAAAGDGGASLTALLAATRGAGAAARDGESGWTPLHVALYGCHLRAAAVLLRIGGVGGLRVRDAGGAAPLDVVVRPGDELPPPSRRGGAGLGVGAAAVDLPPRLLCLPADDAEGAGAAADDNLADGGDAYTDADVVAVATADQHSLMLDATGGVWSVGVGHGGRLGHGDTRTRPLAGRVAALGRVGVVAVAASRRRSAALSAGGTLYMWGGGGDDEAPGGGSAATGAPGACRHDVLDADAGGASLLPRPVTAGGLRTVALTSVALADTHTLATDGDGAVWGWGDNAAGALVLDAGVRFVGTPRRLPAFVDVAVAAVYTAADGCGACAALTADGGVLVWGGDGAGASGAARRKTRRLGLAPLFAAGTHVHRPAPPPVVVSLAVAAAGVAAVTDSGWLYVWRSGVSGAGAYTASPVTAGLPGGRNAVGVAAAGDRLLVADAVGDVYRLPWAAAVAAAGRRSGWAADRVPTVRGVVALAAGRHHALDGEAEDADSTDEEEAEVAVAAAPPPAPAAVATDGGGDDGGVPTLQRLCEAAVLSELRLSTAAELLEIADTLSLGGLRQTCLAFFGANADILLATRGAAALDSLHDTTLEAVEAYMRMQRGLPPLAPPPLPPSLPPHPAVATVPPSPPSPSTAGAAGWEAAPAVVDGGLPPPVGSAAGAAAAPDATGRRARALRKKMVATVRLAERAARGEALAAAEAAKLAHRPALERQLVIAVAAAADAAEAEERRVAAAEAAAEAAADGEPMAAGAAAASPSAPARQSAAAPATESPLLRAPTVAPSRPPAPSGRLPRPPGASLPVIHGGGGPRLPPAASAGPRLPPPASAGGASGATSWWRPAAAAVAVAATPPPPPSPVSDGAVARGGGSPAAGRGDPPQTDRRRLRHGRSRPVLVMGALQGGDAPAVAGAVLSAGLTTRGWGDAAPASPAAAAAVATAGGSTSGGAAAHWLTPLPAPSSRSLADIQLQQVAEAGRAARSAAAAAPPATDSVGSGNGGGSGGRAAVGVALTALLRSSPQAIPHRRGPRVAAAAAGDGGAGGTSPASPAGVSAWGAPAGASPPAAAAAAWSPPPPSAVPAPAARRRRAAGTAAAGVTSPVTPAAAASAAASAAPGLAGAPAADAAARRSFRAIQDEEEAARRRGVGRMATDRLAAAADAVPVGGPPPAGRWFCPTPAPRKPLRAIEDEERAMEALRRAHPGVVVRRVPT